MAGEFILKLSKTSFWLTLLLFSFSILYGGLSFATGFLIGALWNIVNLWILARIIAIFLSLSKEGKRKKKVAFLFVLKFPVLYGLGYLTVRYGGFSAVGLLCGFSLPFTVIIFKALGRSLTYGMPERNPVRPFGG